MTGVHQPRQATWIRKGLHHFYLSSHSFSSQQQLHPSSLKRYSSLKQGLTASEAARPVGYQGMQSSTTVEYDMRGLRPGGRYMWHEGKLSRAEGASLRSRIMPLRQSAPPSPTRSPPPSESPAVVPPVTLTSRGKTMAHAYASFCVIQARSSTARLGTTRVRTVSWPPVSIVVREVWRMWCKRLDMLRRRDSVGHPPPPGIPPPSVP